MMRLFWGANPYNITANSIGLPTSTPTIDVGISNAITLLMSLVGGLAIIALIYGGLRYVLSQGEAKNLSQAKQIITYAVVGIVLASVALALVNFLANNIH
jgi:hypothetical protein